MKLSRNLQPFIKLCDPVVGDKYVVYGLGNTSPFNISSIVKPFCKDVIIASVNGVSLSNDDIFISSHCILLPQNHIIVSR